jgi:2-(1,2-epoxy-1,2-dihydrophenyl)acetyl-CoA isomerase
MSTLQVDRAGGVVEITLTRPERMNAIDQEMFRELLDAFREISRQPEDRVVVITGSEGNFCSGADMSSPKPQESRLDRMREVADVALALHRLARPTIAKVRGVAAGAGCNLALGCDLVVADEGARFSEIFVKRGLSLDFGGSFLLPRLVGLHKAKELAFFGDLIAAQEAVSIGLINRVVPSEELDEFVADWARRLAAGPPVALSLNKSLLNSGLNSGMADALEHEGRSQTVNFGLHDAQEGRDAFLEKRAPRFTGT